MNDLHNEIVEMKYTNNEMFNKIQLVMHLIQVAQLSLSPEYLEVVFGDLKYLNDYSAEESISDAFAVEELSEMYEHDEQFQSDPLVNKCMENRLQIAMDIVGEDITTESVMH